jgi:hypothetical protein
MPARRSSFGWAIRLLLVMYCAWSPQSRWYKSSCGASQTGPSRLGQVDRHFEPDGKGLLGGQ